MRILLQTGNPSRFRFRVIPAAVSGYSRSRAPAPLFSTFGMGHAILMPNASQRTPLSRIASPALTRDSASPAKSWTTRGTSASAWEFRSSIVPVFRFPFVSPVALIISVWTRPTPSRTKRRRTEAIVIPARGASQTLFRTATFPRRTPYHRGRATEPEFRS